MLGTFVVVASVAGVIGLNRLVDQGSRERSHLRSTYGTLIPVMADFERSGGRLQELDDTAALIRRMTIRKLLIQPLVWALVGLLQLVLGFPFSIVAFVIAMTVVGSTISTWMISDWAQTPDGEARQSPEELRSGLVVTLLKGILVFTGVLLAHRGASLINDGPLLSGVALAVIGVLIAAYCYVPAARVDRHVRQKRMVEFATTTKAGAVLYLRSFADDEFRIFTPYTSAGLRFRIIPGRVRFEEFIVGTLYGPSEVVAVGRPGERLPALGASRTYWDEDNWHDAIRSTASRGKALIVLAGRTASLKWEIDQLQELGILGKTIIVFPPDDEAATAERYSFITSVLNVPEELILPPPLYDALTAVAFDQGSLVHYLACGRDWSSYIATTMHFFRRLEGAVGFEAPGTLVYADERADDPYTQAAYLLDRGRKPEAVELIAEAADTTPSARIQIGRAWAAVELAANYNQACEFLRSAQELADRSEGSSSDLNLRDAMSVLEAVEIGQSSARDILKLRDPKISKAPIQRIRSGKATAGRITAVRFVKAMQASIDAEEAGNTAQACEYAQQAQEVARRASLPTAVAAAGVQAGGSLLARGKLQEASETFRSASTLSNAPNLSLSSLMPALDPVEIVDLALIGLCKVAEARGDSTELIDGLVRLQGFREEYEAPEAAAWTAIEVGRAYGRAGQHESARDWALRACTGFKTLGNVDGAARASYWYGYALSKLGRFTEAHASFVEASAGAKIIGNDVLEQDAYKLAAEVERSIG